MIDTKELRRLAQAATPNVGHACKYQDHHSLREGHVDFENADLFIASERPQEDAAFYAAANPQAILELLDRLEAAEKERDALRAKIEQMERQEPVAWAATDETRTVVEALGMNQSRRFDSPLFLAAGAQPAPSVPEGFVLVNAARFLAVLDREDWRTARNRAELRAMLAAAPEAKP